MWSVDQPLSTAAAAAADAVAKAADLGCLDDRTHEVHTGESAQKNTKAANKAPTRVAVAVAVDQANLSVAMIVRPHSIDRLLQEAAGSGSTNDSSSAAGSRLSLNIVSLGMPITAAVPPLLPVHVSVEAHNRTSPLSASPPESCCCGEPVGAGHPSAPPPGKDTPLPLLSLLSSPPTVFPRPPPGLIGGEASACLTR